jgi:hypothetical protein
MLPPEEHFEIDSMGRFLNDDGQPYAMIHQYDRYVAIEFLNLILFRVFVVFVSGSVLFFFVGIYS